MKKSIHFYTNIKSLPKGILFLILFLVLVLIPLILTLAVFTGVLLLTKGIVRSFLPGSKKIKQARPFDPVTIDITEEKPYLN